MSRRNIVLIGFAGCGKSSVGIELARLLNMRFVDIDSEIERSESLTIPDIFEKFGESHFRDLETGAVEIAAEYTDCVIATGGGCIKRDCNMHHLRRSGIVVYLECTAKKIYSNIRHDTGRPLLQTLDKQKAISALMADRRSLYEKYADVTISVECIGIDEAAGMTVDALKAAGFFC